MSRFLIPYYAAAAAGKQVSFSRARNWGVIDGTLYSTTEPVKLPTITITTAQTSIVEGTTASWTLTTDEAFTSTTFILITVSQMGSYVNPLNLGDKRVTFGVGETSKTYTLATLNDSTDENDGSVSISLRQAQGVYSIGTPGDVTITVTDNDVPAIFPTLTIQRTKASITEGENGIWTISASPTPNTNVDVLLRVSQVGSYVSSSQLGNQSTQILSGRNSSRFLVSTIDDLASENTGSISVSLRSSVNYRIGTPSSSTISVSDNELTYSLSSASTITLTSSNSSPQGVAFYQGRFYVIDDVQDRVFLYNSSGGFTKSFTLREGFASAIRSPSGVTAEGSRIIYVVDSSTDKIYAYEPVDERAFRNPIDLHSSNRSPVGVAIGPNSSIWVLDSGTDRIYKYNTSSRDFDNITITLNSANSSPRGLAIDSENNFWVVDGDRTVYNYSPSGEFGRAAFRLSSQNSNPTGITVGSSDNDFWVVDRTADRIFKYSGS